MCSLNQINTVLPIEEGISQKEPFLILKHMQTMNRLVWILNMVAELTFGMRKQSFYH